MYICITQNNFIKWIVSHALVYSFIVLKYMNLTLWKKHILGRIGLHCIFWGIWGETELILRILEAKAKYFKGAEEFSFRDSGRSILYFLRAREHGPSGASDVLVWKGELIFSEIIPMGITKLHILFVWFDSLCPSERFFNCVWMCLY